MLCHLRQMALVAMMLANVVAAVVGGANAAAAAPTFNRDVAPILYQNCAACHRPGEVAPFPLLTYNDAAKRAKLIAVVTSKHYMPPWKPDPEPVAFHNERHLQPEQIATLAAWAENGAPEGSGTAPPFPVFPQGWSIGNPDIVVPMPVEFEVPAEGPDVVQCFVAPMNLAEDRYVSAAEFRPGAQRVVHHAILYVDTSGEARKKDLATPEPGYPCFGGPGFIPSAALGGWAPGWRAQPSPPETASKIGKGADLIIQIHYHPGGKAERDQSSVGLVFTEKPPRERVNLITISQQIDIPPNDPHYVVKASIVVPADIDAFGVAPHAHYLCKETTGRAILPDGSTIELIHIRDWDFNWQSVYQFEHPIRLPKGTRLELTFVYDNSEANPRNPSHPPRAVHYGEKTTDEMAALMVPAMLVHQEDSPSLHRELKLAALDQMLREGNLPFATNAPRLKRVLRLLGTGPDHTVSDARRRRFLRVASFWLDLHGDGGRRSRIRARLMVIAVLSAVTGIIWFAIRRIRSSPKK